MRDTDLKYNLNYGAVPEIPLFSIWMWILYSHFRWLFQFVPFMFADQLERQKKLYVHTHL